MVLTVPYDGFAAAKTRQGVEGPVGLWTIAGRTVLSCVHTERLLLLQCSTSKPRRVIEEQLNELGIEWHEGRWTEGGDVEELPTTSFWIAAVAYRSTESKPGLWVDAWLREPSVGEVLNRLYEDFRQTGELQETSLEDFLKVAEPNVVILEPDDQLRFAQDAFGC